MTTNTVYIIRQLICTLAYTAFKLKVSKEILIFCMCRLQLDALLI